MNETKNKQWEVNFYFRQKEIANNMLKSLYQQGLEPEYKEREVQRYTLKEYIEFLGEESAAKLFDCQPSTIKAYRYGKRRPSIEQAKIIIRNTGGKLDFESIYGSVTDTKKES
tara:strand:- start:1028 stop:1366 length:339 start_codon:yes stop_codon:yes gene_type:complete